MPAASSQVKGTMQAHRKSVGSANHELPSRRSSSTRRRTASSRPELHFAKTFVVDLDMFRMRAAMPGVGLAVALLAAGGQVAFADTPHGGRAMAAALPSELLPPLINPVTPPDQDAFYQPPGTSAITARVRSSARAPEKPCSTHAPA
jgi:hypothetical protein